MINIETDDIGEIDILIRRLNRQRPYVRKITVEVEDESEIFIHDLPTLLQHFAFPKAVNPDFIITTEQEKKLRAFAILQGLFPDGLQDKSFLDFGCGEGHTIIEAQKQGTKISIGYDLVSTPHWNSNFTTDINTLPKFDYILLHDVLDHTVDIEEVLKQVKGLMHSQSKVIIRSHPWSSRHGGHMYHYYNKAFAHLIFADGELGYYEETPATKVINPASYYTDLFTELGFSIEKVLPIYNDVESFFHTNFEIIERLREELKTDNPYPIMRISFIDFELTKGE